ncbi:hypothetical protein [Planobispora longispora]|nr:hypothetical protein [Planobispora longispora]
MSEGGYSLRIATADDADFLTDMLVAAVNWDPAREAVSRDRVLCLSVERANRARRLYAAEGFTTVGSGPDSDTMIMVLSGR